MTKKIRVLIVDDEPLARKTIRLLLQADPAIEIVGECGDGRAALRAIQEKAPDLVFLDVQMPGMDGLQVIESLGVNDLPAIIFVTAYDKYALKAFDAEAVDYLLKPFDDDRFKRSLQRAKSMLSLGTMDDAVQRLTLLLSATGKSGFHAPTAESAGRPIRLAIKTRGKIVFLHDSEIDWIKAADYYVEIHGMKGKFLHRESLQSLEKKLDKKRFARIHRSTIVNLERIKEILPSRHGDFEVVLRDGTILRMSRSRRRAVA